MFNIGGMELVVIALVALVVIGPDKLPGAVRQAGKVMGDLRRISQGFQTDIRAALDEAEREAARAETAGRPRSADPAPADPRSAMEAAKKELDELDAGADELG